MKAYYYIIFLGFICTACQITPQEIKQDIYNNNVIPNMVEQYKHKETYIDISKTIENLDKLEEKQVFTDADMDSLSTILYDNFIELEDLHKHSYGFRKRCLEKVSNDELFMKNFIRMLETDTETYCKRYKDKENFTECKRFLYTNMCEKLFDGATTYEGNSNIEKNRQKYIEKKLQKTGCKYADAITYPGRLYQVLQQTPKGTLIEIMPMVSAMAYSGYPRIAFITKNSTDSNLTDEERLFPGYFQDIGTYQYTNSNGGTSTVKKFKRCIDKTW